MMPHRGLDHIIWILAHELQIAETPAWHFWCGVRLLSCGGSCGSAKRHDFVQTQPVGVDLEQP